MTMDSGLVRITLLPDSLLLDCTGPGCDFNRCVPAAELNRRRLPEIDALAEHRCSAGGLGATAIRARTPHPSEEAMADFVAKNLIPDPEGVVALSDLMNRFELVKGTLPSSGFFSRKLRQALPGAVEIRREMIDGVRARRLVGMRLL